MAQIWPKTTRSGIKPWNFQRKFQGPAKLATWGEEALKDKFDKLAPFIKFVPFINKIYNMVSFHALSAWKNLIFLVRESPPLA